MGDICDANDLNRFMRSPEGGARLDEIRQMLLQRVIVDVTFGNEVNYISVNLHLDNGETFSATQPILDVEVLRNMFEEVIEREYYVDYPERSPKTPSAL